MVPARILHAGKVSTFWEGGEGKPCRRQPKIENVYASGFEVDGLTQSDRRRLSIAMYCGDRRGEKSRAAEEDLSEETESRMQWTAGIFEPVDEKDIV